MKETSGTLGRAGFAEIDGLRTAIRRAIAAAAATVASLMCTHSWAQCASTWVPGIGTPGTNYTVYATTVLPDGDVIVGGRFTDAGGTTANNVARFNPTSGVWSELGAGTNSYVNALAVLPGGDMIAGGDFTSVGGVAVNRIARFNPSTGVWSAMGAGIKDSVTALAVTPSGNLIVGGRFSTAGGAGLGDGMARYNPTTGAWGSLGRIPIGTVNALVALPGGDVLVGGDFSSAGGVPANNIARVNPTTRVWTALGIGTSARVLCLKLLPGGDVIVGGSFYSAGGVGANNIARYNPTTGIWSNVGSLDAPNGLVRSVEVLPGGDLFVGGDFTFMTDAGVLAVQIARVSQTTGVWSALGAGALSSVYTLAALPGGDVIVGGAFSTAGDMAAGHIARITPGENAPSFTVQPSPQNACAGGSVAFTVIPIGTGPFTYQWRKANNPIDTIANPSAGSAVLTLTNVSPADAASYDCIATNACGTVTCIAAALTIVQPCALADIAADASQTTRCGNGAVGPEDIEAFVNGFIAENLAIADVASDSADTAYNPNGSVGPEDLEAFVNSFIAGC